jgi:hypothetical protein
LNLLNFQNKKFRIIVALIVAATGSYILIPGFFEAGIYPLDYAGASWLSLDPSWKLNLWIANKQNLTWGDEFLFTYGPLSFFSTRLTPDISTWVILVFDLFVAFNFFCIYYLNILRSNNLPATVILICASVVLLPPFFGSGLSLILLAFLLFWLNESLNNLSPWILFNQAVLLCLLFFIKFNSGLIAFVLFLISLLYVFVNHNKPIRIRISLMLAAMVLLVLGLSYILNVSPGSYIKGGMELITGHNDIMYLNEPFVRDQIFAAGLIILTAAVFIYASIKDKKNAFMHSARFITFYICMYVLYKQAFVRRDIQHVSEFFRYFLLFILCVPGIYFSWPYRFGHSLIAITLTCYYIQFSGKKDVVSSFKSRFNKSDYLQGLKVHSSTSAFNLYEDKNQIPEKIKKLLNGKKVDVFPWNSHLLFENRLQYRPRPVSQTYVAYTPYLASLNIKHYESEKAPEYILYEYDALDNRYPLFEEPLLNKIIFSNYTCRDTFSYSGRLTLLLEKQNNRRLRCEKVKEYVIGMEEKIVPVKNTLYKINVKNSLTGKVVTLLDHAPELFLEIRTADNKLHEYRTGKKLLESGIYSGEFLSSTLDVFYQLNGQNELLQKITGYSLRAEKKSMFENNIIVTEFLIR